MLVRKDLDLAANAHVKGVLAYRNDLCRGIATHLDSLGVALELFAYVPEEVDVASIDFAAGGLILPAARYLPSYLEDRCRQTAYCGLAFDDVMADESDIKATAVQNTAFHERGNVYHYVDCTISDAAAIEQVVWATTVSWHFVCALFSYSCPLSKDEFVTRFRDKNIYADLREVVVGAFDGEGYVHCRIRGQGVKSSNITLLELPSG